MSNYTPQGFQDDGTFICAYVPSCPFITAEIADQRKRADEAEARVKELKSKVIELEKDKEFLQADRAFWRSKYKKLKKEKASE